MAVDVTVGDDFRVGSPTPLVERGSFLGSRARSYDVGPDASFFMVVPSAFRFAEGVTTELHVVLNFGHELRQRLPN
jgi:hypothetical protein